jgi:hypothetical protein
MRLRLTLLAGILAAQGFAAGASRAQHRNEVGLVMGATVVPSQSFSSGSTARVEFDPSLTLGVDYDRLLFSASGVAFYLGGDFVASEEVQIANPPADLISLYAYLFLTPHLRAKVKPQGALSPWLSLGGGYARFLEKAPAANPAYGPGTNTGTLMFGGGIDTKPVVRVLGLPIGFRVEVRDFYSGLPRYDQATRGNLQHHVTFTGGLLISF